jgi:hypothetical protein
LRELGDFGDSSGIGVAAIQRTIARATSDMLRRSVCNVLGAWSAKDGAAKKALLATLESPDAEVRLAAVEANGYEAFKGLRNAITRRVKDPDPVIRVAAIDRLNYITRWPDRMTDVVLDALKDPSPVVRMDVIRGCASLYHFNVDSSKVASAIRALTTDPDSAVAATARRALQPVPDRRSR